MKRLFLSICAALLLTSTANADLNFTVAVGDELSFNTIAPGATCTYGGLFIEQDPVVGATTSSNFCFPGSSATSKTYEDQNGDIVAGLIPGTNIMRGFAEGLYWDDSNNTYWPVNTMSGQVDFVVMYSIYYASDTCTGDLLMPYYYAENSVMPSMSGGYYVLESFYTPSTCYYLSGESCINTNCYDAMVIVSPVVGSPPDFSSYTPPFKIVKAP